MSFFPSPPAPPLSPPRFLSSSRNFFFTSVSLLPKASMSGRSITEALRSYWRGAGLGGPMSRRLRRPERIYRRPALEASARRWGPLSIPRLVYDRRLLRGPYTVLQKRRTRTIEGELHRRLRRFELTNNWARRRRVSWGEGTRGARGGRPPLASLGRCPPLYTSPSSVFGVWLRPPPAHVYSCPFPSRPPFPTLGGSKQSV